MIALPELYFIHALDALLPHYTNWGVYHPFTHLYSYTLNHKSEFQYHLYRVRDNQCKFSETMGEL